MQVILNKSEKIEQTVAMPCFNAKNIAWLSMESLCNQVEVNHHWELLICEEEHEGMTGADFFKQYIDRLVKAGCMRIVYILIPEWIPLPQKWKILGEASHRKSMSFLLKAADCYSPSKRLSITYKYINKRNYDWIDFCKGYFYNFNNGGLIVYNKASMTNLNMAFKTSFAKNIPFSEKRKGIDGLLFKFFKIRKRYIIGSLYADSLDTDGHNNISKREKHYQNPMPPFASTAKTLDDLNLPDYVKEKIKLMTLER